MSNNWQFHITKSKVLKWLQLCSPEEAHEDLTLTKECSASYVSCRGYQDSLRSDGGSTIKKQNKETKFRKYELQQLSMSERCTISRWFIWNGPTPITNHAFGSQQPHHEHSCLQAVLSTVSIQKVMSAADKISDLVQSLGIKTKMTAKLLQPFYHAPSLWLLQKWIFFLKGQSNPDWAFPAHLLQLFSPLSRKNIGYPGADSL